MLNDTGRTTIDTNRGTETFGSRNRLAELAAKIKRNSSDEARGPLIIAAEVIAAGENWEAYRAEAEGKDFEQWIRWVAGPGRGRAFFARRLAAIERIGEHARRRWHHDAAHWAASNIESDDNLRRLNDEVLTVTAAGGGVPLNEDIVRRIAVRIGVYTPAERVKVCGECERLRALLLANGIEH